ncbi:ATP-grasp fold amidoligase family protein [Clostridium perfringens]|uniref:ATP-grasp fold amidoligase family protein n=1 Tax=Clostridium perfringens TaxID=1502 RepID=UPI000DA26BB7|nr:ATP-grasp fold amidoligase family protein [Clostridium perfringens]SQI03077.1 glycosyltransferase [Clostridium perfringens]HBI6973919.1 glycosyl transferase [Clostridium perfringens]
MKNKIRKAITSPSKIILYLIEVHSNWFWWMPDKTFLSLKFKFRMGKKLDLSNPQTFNEKLQWLKLYNRKSEYTMMADKYLVRKYIADKLGEEYLIPIIGVWDEPNEINFEKLPNKFVLKCNHNSGLGMCICRNKNILDIKKTKKNLKKGIRQDYYLTSREWPYKNIKRKIIAEKYMEDSNRQINDYKFTCFNGKVDNVMICIDRSSKDTKFYFFDRDWNLMRLNKRGKEAPKDFTLEKPKNLDKMFQIAEELSKGLPYARIDLYNLDGKIYFGEITFFPEAGYDSNLLSETDKYFGNQINLDIVRR